MGANGRVVIPAELRRELGIERGDELLARTEGQRLILETRDALLHGIQAEFRAAAGDRGLVDELIARRRAEAKREQREIERWAKSLGSSTRR
jgi:AbrB family looped-hinge helix DNA binding protein